MEYVLRKISSHILGWEHPGSALDVETELRFWASLAAWQPDATLLVISHRQPVLRRADRLLLLAEPLTAHPDMRAIWSGETKEAELRVPEER